MSLALGTRLEQYEVVGALGAGGMGEVYRAADSRLKREVALKILRRSLRTPRHGWLGSSVRRRRWRR